MKHRQYKLEIEVSPALIADLIFKAEAIYGAIEPCGTGKRKKTWRECVAGGLFWFNTRDHSTHVIKIFLEKPESTVEKEMNESINKLQW